jgi:hypothetical protein
MGDTRVGTGIGLDIFQIRKGADVPLAHRTRHVACRLQKVGNRGVRLAIEFPSGAVPPKDVVKANPIIVFPC